jgi:hypothetical protein
MLGRPVERSRYVPRASWRVTVPPAIEPISVPDLRAELGAVPAHVTEYSLDRLIKSARSLAEAFTGRAFIRQTITLQLDSFPDRGMPWWDGVRQAPRAAFAGGAPIPLPRPPALALTSVTWWDSSDAPHALDLATVELDTMSEPARLVLLSGQSWPAARYRAGVQIVFDAGYGDNTFDVPPEVAEAIVMHARDAIERPNPSVSTERIDNVSTTYGNAPTGATAEGGGRRSGGLRGGAGTILEPLRVLEVGL